MSELNFNVLTGLTLVKIEGLSTGSGEVIFHSSDGRIFKLHHYQSCCESVTIEDVYGDAKDILNTPILSAEEVSSPRSEENYRSQTWTFYKLSTIKGSVTIRWYGTSNGYYSERVDFMEVKDE